MQIRVNGLVLASRLLATGMSVRGAEPARGLRGDPAAIAEAPVRP